MPITLADIESPRAGSARRSAPSGRPRARRAPARRVPGSAGHGRHAGRPEPGAPGSAATWTRQPSTCGAPRSSASPPGCRRTPTAGGSRWRGSGAAEGDLDAAARAARGGRAGVRRRLLPRRAARCRAMRARVSRRAATSPSALDWARQHELSSRRRPDLPARVRARHPGPGPARASSDDGRTALAPPRLLDRLLAAAEAGARFGTVIEILVLRALAHSTRRRSRPRWRPSSAPSSWPSPRVTSGSSRRGRADGRAAGALLDADRVPLLRDLVGVVLSPSRSAAPRHRRPRPRRWSTR